METDRDRSRLRRAPAHGTHRIGHPRAHALPLGALSTVRTPVYSSEIPFSRGGPIERLLPHLLDLAELPRAHEGAEALGAQVDVGAEAQRVVERRVGAQLDHAPRAARLCGWRPRMEPFVRNVGRRLRTRPRTVRVTMVSLRKSLCQILM